jgi:hypothetical protein
MIMVTYSKARQHFAEILDIAGKEGEVLIKRQNGQVYSIRPGLARKTVRSPLNIKGIRLNLTGTDIINAVRESRERA